MAQSKRKRHTKHRGNAAGIIETRGRTGRPLKASERKDLDRNQRREERLNRKPTWRSAAQRAALAGVMMFFVLLFFGPKKSSDRVLSAVIYAIMAMILYVLLGYYIEIYLWRRRMAKKQAQAAPR
ncbi:hypothetical protein [Conexibacter sp. S30A1]|jgi:uncharacterized membrane protein|uniref:hypothetical protein n=1 Tax=Conexibacter sp. S30A1 TaxID=2937800 RepID=UPI00200D5DCF|nr:hypothetical protein [Conexibacter sp. S30A1]